MFYSHVRQQEGQGLVEYALILILVAVVTVVILAILGTSIRETYSCIVHELGAVGNVSIGSSGVYQYTLIDADTDQPIGRASCGQSLSTNSNINFRADAPAGVTSINFTITLPDGSVIERTENAAPWAVFGDSNGDYSSALDGTLGPGRYEIFAETNTGETSSFVFYVAE